MTQSQPVTRVVDILTTAGYRHRTTPVTVASVPIRVRRDPIGLGSRKRPHNSH